MPFGQVVVGPPGSGKTTYCNGMQQFLSALGRKTAVINLDPANDALPYECSVDIEELIKLDDVMTQYGLGPNGGLVYCMDYLEQNIDWLEKKLEPLAKDYYLLFDLPGQVELFTLHPHFKNVIETMTNKWNFRLTAVHLIDSHLCTDPGNYVSALLLSLSTMLHLGLPHINVLSKIDMIQQYGPLAFNLDFYTEVQDLGYLAHHLNQDPRFQRYRKLTEGLCEVIQDYGMVSFATLNINDKESVYEVVKLVDKSNGYVFAGIEGDVTELSKVAAGDTNWNYYKYPPHAASPDFTLTFSTGRNCAFRKQSLWAGSFNRVSATSGVRGGSGRVLRHPVTSALASPLFSLRAPRSADAVLFYILRTNWQLLL